MDTAKTISLFFQSITVVLALLSYFKINSEDLPQILQSILSVPSFVYVVLFLIFLIFYLTRKENVRHVPRIVAIGRDLQKVGEVEYKGVKWDVRAPAPSHYDTQLEYEKRLPDMIDVKKPPKCPKCGVGLEEKKSRIYGYIWKCVGCGFSKRNIDSFYAESERAERIWKAACEAGTLTQKK
jgi:ribosomal protein L37AE/L43A